jgi:hypothetical protein
LRFIIIGPYNGIMIFYCPNCRREIETEPATTITTKTGRVAYKASCPTCGLDLAEFATPQSPAPSPPPQAPIQSSISPPAEPVTVTPVPVPITTEPAIATLQPVEPSEPALAPPAVVTADESIQAYMETLADNENEVVVEKPTQTVKQNTSSSPPETNAQAELNQAASAVPAVAEPEIEEFPIDQPPV